MRLKALRALPGMGRPILLLFVIVLSVHVPCSAQKKVSIYGRDLPIDSIINMVQRQTDYRFEYSADIFLDWPGITLDLTNVPIRVFLDSCFSGLNFERSIEGKTIFIGREPYNRPLYAELHGRVVNEANEPLPHVNIAVEGTSFHIPGREDGSFIIQVHGFSTWVRISCPGYITQRRELYNKSDNTIVLQQEATKLNEVVIEGYNIISRRAITETSYALNSRDISIQNVSNPLECLQGEVPGLNIVRTNGFSAGPYKVTVRGRHSIGAGNEPLYIIDGVPFPPGSFIGIIGPGSPLGGSNTLNGIAPEDIDKITALSGPFATAIYGSRAANGVILITLKKGLSGKLRVTADVSSGPVRTVKISPLLNTRQFLQLREEAAKNDAPYVGTPTVPELGWDTGRYSNFQKQVLGNTGRSWHGHIGLTGGGSDCYFLLSGDMNLQSTVLPGKTQDSRQSLYGYLHIQSPDSRLRLSISGLYSWQGENLPMEDLTKYMYLAPNAPAFLDANQQPVWSSGGLSFANILALENNTYKLGVYNLLGHLQSSWLIKKDLSVETNLGFYRLGASEQGTTTISGQDPGQTPPPTGQLFLGSNQYVSGIAEMLVRYSHEWKRGGLLETFIGGTWQGERKDSMATASIGFNSDYQLATASGGITTFLRDRVNYEYAALFGQCTYTLNKKYILSATGRRDGSSRWSKGNQYGNFVSLGASWIFSEESFFKKWQALSLGKLRASFGTAGNDQIPDYQYARSYATINARGQQGFLPATLYDPSLRWELYHNQELGLELGFLKDKLSFTVVGYRSYSKDQLLKNDLALQAGEPGVMSDLPIRVQNEGLEIVVRGKIGEPGCFQWASTLDVTLPQNRLVSYPGLASSSNATSFVEGQSLSVSKGYHFTGVDMVTGLYTFANSHRNGVPDFRDFVSSKSLDPRCYGAWSNNFSYKQWQVDIVLLFYLQNGYDPLIALDEQNLPGAGTEGPYQLSNGPKEWLSRWQKKGDRSSRQQLTSTPNTPAANALNYYIASDANVIDASYARLKTLALSYGLLEERLKRLRIKGLQVYFRAHNLFTFTRYPVTDPETQNPMVLPPTRSWETGFTLTL